jgi:hypothetical protein
MRDSNVPLIIMERVAALRLPAIHDWAYWADKGAFMATARPHKLN